MITIDADFDSYRSTEQNFTPNTQIRKKITEVRFSAFLLICVRTFTKTQIHKYANAQIPTEASLLTQGHYLQTCVPAESIESNQSNAIVFSMKSNAI